MRVKRSTDCGNSPKNKLVQSISIALIKADSKQLSLWVSEDVEWIIADKKPVVGLSQIIETIKGRQPANTVTLTIEHVLSHGKVGAANGILKLANGKTSSFCHVLEFTNTTARLVRRIYSYGSLF